MEYFALLRSAFEANLFLNAAVLALLSLGVAIDLGKIIALRSAFQWIDSTRRGFAVQEPPWILAPLARVLAGKEREGFMLSTLAMGVLLDGVRRRLDEARHLPGQLLLLLVLLGLLGLLRNHAPFGIAAVVALGLMHALLRGVQNRFFWRLEEFLAERAELPSRLLGGEATLPAYLEALLKQAAENLAELQRMMTRTEEDRRAMQGALTSLTETLASMSDHLRAEHKVMLSLSKSHHELQPGLAELATQVADATAGSEEVRSHLRNLDIAVARLLDEVSAAREQAPEAMRQEIKLLAQTLAARGDRPHF